MSRGWTGVMESGGLTTSDPRVDELCSAPWPLLVRMKVHASAVLVLQFALASFVLMTLIWQLSGNNPYYANLKADYLRARALRDRQDIFVSIDALSERYLPTRGVPFVDPSPHPPVVALVLVPATFLPYTMVCILWDAMAIGLLFAVGRWLGFSPLASLALGAWPPLYLSLKYLQWEPILLLLVMLAWREAERRNDGRAGLWLGIAATIKFYPGFLVLPFLVRRRFRLAFVAAATVLAGQIGNVIAVGPLGAWRYYTRVLPSLGLTSYAGSIVDNSVHGELLRLLVSAPSWVVPLTAVASLAALVALLSLPLKAGPIAVLLLLPTYVLSGYTTLGLPLIVSLWHSGRNRPLTIAATLAASFPYYVVMGFVSLPASPALLGAIEPLGFVGLLVAAALILKRSSARSS